MRGKAGKSIDKRHKSGITPAYAGKSPQTAVLFLRRSGSPPPMRGKGRSRFVLDCDFRITPAYAGKRRSQLADLGLKWDHPRLCGEKIKFYPPTGEFTGSPPPMRGKAY